MEEQLERLTSYVGRLRARYPAIRVDVVVSIAKVNLPRGDADIAIRQFPQGKDAGEASVVARKVGEFGFALYGSPSYLESCGRPTLPVDSLAGHKLISFATDVDKPGVHRWAIDRGAEPIFSTNTLQTVQAGVVAGLGLGVLPCMMADMDPGLTRVSELIESFNVWLVSNADSATNPRVSAIKQALAELIEAEAHVISGHAPL